MEIKIFSLKLKNFKGIKNLAINFNCKNANIYGKNATGKTTIFDAFKWLFFDKDSNDKKDFNIKTLDENNNAIHFLEHEVEAVLVIDGVDMTFKKVFKEKWIKKRGQEQQEFSGHETMYYIDEVPIKKKDYEEKINQIIPENLFKLITDPLFFNSKLSMQEKRELLINVSNANISDNEILDAKEEFKTLKENLEGRTIEDYKKVLYSKIKELNNEKEKIPVRIDELTQTLITEHNIDYNKLEEEKNKCNEEIQKIDAELTDVQIKAKENMKKVDQLSIAKSELHNLKFKLEVEHNNKYSTEAINLNNEKSLIETKIRNNENLISDLEKQISNLNMQIENDQNRKQELYKKWDEIEKRQLEFDTNSFICPTCKREYDTDKIEEMKQEFINNFNNNKNNEKEKINAEGQATNIRITENTERLGKILEEIEKAKREKTELEQRLEEIHLKIEDYEKEKSNEKTFDVTSVPEYQEKKKEVEQLEEIVNNLASNDTTEINNRKLTILEQINNIDKKLNDREVQEKTKARIEELENEEECISQKIQQLELQQYQIEEFTKTKVRLLENSINNKFEVVKFRLFDTQINGGIIECCDTLVNGVPYADVNRGHKILAGLDIIKTLSKFYNTNTLIFVDNSEAITEPYEMNTQLIRLIAKEGQNELKIEVM